MNILEELPGRGASAVIGLILGAMCAWFLARWKRYRERQNILRGDARDTVVIQLHIVTPAGRTSPDGKSATKVPAALRIRPLGQSELHRVVPNGHLASELQRRAFRVTSRDTLISMEGPEGSYLLETLTNFVSDRVGNAPFEHDLYVMAPCCEPIGLAVHQPITILLISVADLRLFESWPLCKDIQIEHGNAGARILTLMELSKRFRAEQEMIAGLRRVGKRTTYLETMYVLDLALDKRTANTPIKEVPWGRFEHILKQLNLE